jgi:hypothetical protein
MSWSEYNNSPYLHDTDGDYIGTSGDNKDERYFGFVNSSGSGTINSVHIYLECRVSAPGAEEIAVWINDGSSDNSVGSVNPSGASYAYENIDISSTLDTWQKIDDAELWLISITAGDWRFVRRAYLYVDYTPSGTEMSEFGSAALTFVVNAFNSWTFDRTGTYTISFGAGGSREVAFNRESTAALSFSTGFARAFSFSRESLINLAFLVYSSQNFSSPETLLNLFGSASITFLVDGVASFVSTGLAFFGSAVLDFLVESAQSGFPEVTISGEVALAVGMVFAIIMFGASVALIYDRRKKDDNES